MLTTYQTVVSDHCGGSKVALGGSSKRKRTDSTLMNIPWKRVIIDEGHQIRNPSTKAAIAVSALRAERRWALTGTPIVCSSFYPIFLSTKIHCLTAELSERSWVSLNVLKDLPPFGPTRLFQSAHPTSIEAWWISWSRTVTGAPVLTWV